MHDSRVLRHITLYQRANTNQMLLEAKANVNDRMLLGDEVSVKLTSKAIHIPSKSSVQEENFNKNLASVKVTVECAFGKLKVRWRCLLTMQKQSPRGVLQKRCSKRFCKIHRKTLVVETLAQVFAYEFFEIFKSTFSYREPPVAASENVSNTIITCFVCTTSVRLMEKLTWKTTVYMKS